jgi:transposase
MERRRGLADLLAITAGELFADVLDHLPRLRDHRGLSAEERCLARQHRSRPLIDALEPWLRTKLGLISQKGKLAEAINYALSRWEGLTRFLDDGRLELDNNTVDNAQQRPWLVFLVIGLRRLLRGPTDLYFDRLLRGP